jgi:hypothetical protein
MARFRATIKGARGEASRLGDAATGLTVTVNGWDLGIRAIAGTTGADADVIDVFITGGSKGRTPERHLGRAYLSPNGPTFDANPTAPTTARANDALTFTTDELTLLVAALASHEYWQYHEEKNRDRRHKAIDAVRALKTTITNHQLTEVK